MAIIENNYVGDGSTVLFPFTFEYIDARDVKVQLDGVDTTAYSLDNATTVRMDTAPAAAVLVAVAVVITASVVVTATSPLTAVWSFVGDGTGASIRVLLSF